MWGQKCGAAEGRYAQRGVGPNPFIRDLSQFFLGERTCVYDRFLPPVFSLEFGTVLYSIYVMYDAGMAIHDCDALTTREFSAC